MTSLFEAGVGFLAAIDALYQAHEAGQSIEGATQVVYLSPSLSGSAQPRLETLVYCSAMSSA